MSKIAYQEGQAYSAPCELVTIECYKCHMLFAMPAYFDKQCHEERIGFFCPQGHEQVYTRSENTKLKEQLEYQKRMVQWEKDNAEYERNRRLEAERSRAAVKGVLTKTKKRIAAGVCPCCNRTFQDLARHMKGQHPDYVVGESGDD